jgi:hypothetical protein
MDLLNLDFSTDSVSKLQLAKTFSTSAASTGSDVFTHRLSSLQRMFEARLFEYLLLTINPTRNVLANVLSIIIKRSVYGSFVAWKSLYLKTAKFKKGIKILEKQRQSRELVKQKTLKRQKTINDQEFHSVLKEKAMNKVIRTIRNVLLRPKCTAFNMLVRNRSNNNTENRLMIMLGGFIQRKLSALVTHQLCTSINLLLRYENLQKIGNGLVKIEELGIKAKKICFIRIKFRVNCADFRNQLITKKKNLLAKLVSQLMYQKSIKFFFVIWKHFTSRLMEISRNYLLKRSKYMKKPQNRSPTRKLFRKSSLSLN